MFTCFIRYVIDPNQIKEFEKYARTWIKLVEKYGGTHHGYFLPGNDALNLPKTKFSFPELGKDGPDNIAVALFSFPDLKTYETYKKDVAADEECQKITDRCKKTKCFLNYERSFLKPIFKE
jgi:hypothetical protein